MKKNFVVLLVLSVILLSGCGVKKETLTCTSVDETITETKPTNEVKVDFEGKEIVKLAMNIDVEVSEQYKDYVNVFKEKMEEQFASFEDQTGMTVDVSEKDNKVLVRLNADYKNMDSKTKKELGIVNEGANLEDVKKSLEDEGFTCK